MPSRIGSFHIQNPWLHPQHLGVGGGQKQNKTATSTTTTNPTRVASSLQPGIFLPFPQLEPTSSLILTWTTQTKLQVNGAFLFTTEVLSW